MVQTESGIYVPEEKKIITASEGIVMPNDRPTPTPTQILKEMPKETNPSQFIAQAPNILLTNPSEEERKLYLAYKHTIAFGQLFLPGDFMRTETPEFHYEIGEELDSPSTKPLLIALPRESAKTTLVKASIIKDFCFSYWAWKWGWAEEQEKLFHVWVAKSQKDSKANVKYVKLHLEFNAKIKRYFGKLRGDTWNQENITTYYNCELASFSNLRSARGQTMPDIEQGTKRISRAFCDDSENELNTKTLNSRNEIKDNILNGLLPAIEKDKPKRRLIITGTPVHYDSLVQNMMDDYDVLKRKGQDKVEKYAWKFIIYKSTQPNRKGGVLWHSHRPKRVLDQIKAEYVASPRGVGGYYQEYELEVVSDSMANWTRKHVKFHDGSYIHENGVNYLYWNGDKFPVNIFGGGDPATDIETRDNDFGVFLTLAVDQYNRRFVLKYMAKRGLPNVGMRGDGDKLIGKMGYVDHLFDDYDRYHMDKATVEDVAMNRSIFTGLRARKNTLNRYDVNVAPYPPGGTEKLNRIYSVLDDLFASGLIYIREDMDELFHQITKFGPKLAHEDVIEGLFLACINAYPYRVKGALPPTPEEVSKLPHRARMAALRRRGRQRGTSWITR